METPHRDDLTVKSDMWFRQIMGQVGGSVRMAASREFPLVGEMRRLVEEDEIMGWTEEEIGDKFQEGLPEHEVAVGISPPSSVAVDAEDNGFEYSRQLYVRNRAWHASCYIDHSGMDYGKILFANQLELYLSLQIPVIGTVCEEVGKYAWAKYGFNAGKDDRQRLYNDVLWAVDLADSKIPKEVARTKVDGPGIPSTLPDHMSDLAVTWLTEDMYAFLKKMQGGFGLEDAESDSDYRGSDGSYLLGKYGMINSNYSWSGQLRLGDGHRDREILERYISEYY